jgi:hypothetical protein
MVRYARLGSILLAVLASLAVVLIGRSARADSPGGTGAAIYVLDIQSLQADGSADDQAKALTSALRSRVRASPQWQLHDADHSFETFRLTLKCPIGQEPDAACLQRIADNIKEGREKADRYVWGEMRRQGTNEVNVTVHLWQRGKPDVTTSETYSDNLKDENDEALRTIAERVVSALTGGKQTGTITLHAGNVPGAAVFVDGAQQGTLDATGTAHLEVATGDHTIEIRAQGYQPSSQKVKVAAAAEQDLTFTLTPAPTVTQPPPETTTGSHVPVRKIIGWSAIGLGAVSMGVGVIEGAHFLSLKSDLDNDRNQVPASVSDVCQDLSTPASIDACNKFKDARTARTLEWVFLGLGAALVGGGVVVLVTDPGDKESAPPPRTSAHLTPHFSRGGAGLDFDMTF